ncbi:MAG: phosphoribosylglycinamide formyltransferase [Firmicutes bacterium]|nr:phosphoribosylglycinamide formyltransferase [Bacillota bacterium]
MLKVPIAVLVSGGGTNLEHLLLAQEAGQLPHGEIRLVVSNNPDAYALTRAANHGVAAAVADHRGRSQAEFEAALQRLLEENGIRLIILAGFLRILSADFVARWPERIINVHPSLIPSFCGAGFYGLKVHHAALDYGVKVSGATVHLVNEEPDGGRILLQKAVEVLPDDTPETLQRRIMEQAEWVLLPQAAELMCKKITEEES